MKAKTLRIDPDSLVVRDATLPVTPVDEDLVIINIATGRYVGLNDIGRLIWDRIETPTRVRDLYGALAAHFAGDPDVIAQDANAFLQQLADEALIRVED